jgi:hypothetical protein
MSAFWINILILPAMKIYGDEVDHFFRPNLFGRLSFYYGEDFWKTVDFRA